MCRNSKSIYLPIYLLHMVQKRKRLSGPASKANRKGYNYTYLG
jgi:hypothetical protein